MPRKRTKARQPSGNARLRRIRVHARESRTDRRILRTRDQLGDAIIELMQERPFDSITVREILDRARVGRSTFYAHYKDKDDLLFSDVEEFLEAMSTVLLRHREASDRVAPVREFFAHVAEGQSVWRAFVDAGRIHDFLELARGHFARAIGQRLASHARSRGLSAGERAALAQGLAGALLGLLAWWVRGSRRESPEQIDALFHRLVGSGAGGPPRR